MEIYSLADHTSQAELMILRLSQNRIASLL